ncbi:hypothetical protein [Streptomyces boninensis]|uniref:hypothetical protein n=1 Tax=Streptomyces boninensis TaxID=2039455 RepID=UPI003B225FCD
MPTVTFRDETATGRPVAEAWEAPGLPDRMTVRELIRLRVREEVARHNAHPMGGWERQAEIAEHAFLANGFFVLAGERQVEELDEVVDLTEVHDLVFIRLVPLAGG